MEWEAGFVSHRPKNSDENPVSSEQKEISLFRAAFAFPRIFIDDLKILATKVKDILSIKFNDISFRDIVISLPIIFLVLGYIVWVPYLYLLGFSENEIIKPRFILTGINLLFFIFILYIVFFKRIINFFWKIIFWIFFLLSYLIVIFPIMPLFIGGGLPRALSIIADNQIMVQLNSLGISKGAGAEFQTENLCIAYEGSDSYLILREDRVLKIDKIGIGLASLPGRKEIEWEPSCSLLAQSWLWNGFTGNIKLASQLLINSILVIVGEIFMLIKILMNFIYSLIRMLY